MGIDMVNETSLRRRLLFDSMEDPVAACALIGLPGMSDEGVEAEEADSRRRLAALSNIMPALLMISQWTAEIALAFQIEENDVELPPEFQEQMLEMFNSVAQASIVSTISVLNDMGVVMVSEGGTGG